MQMQKTLKVGQVSISNQHPMVLLGGMNVLESAQLANEVAEHYVAVTQKLGIPYVFKASFDKANRSSINSFRGPGLDKGLQILADIKATYQVPIITDVHEPYQAAPVAEVADIIQLPAFLCRQTDLVKAMADTNAIVNIKKAQFLSAHDMRHVLKKFESLDNNQLMLCERGNCFGYNNLIVDMLNFPIMKSFGYPVIFDVTHSLQLPGGQTESAGGRRQLCLDLARAGVSIGLAGLFLEAHPDPDKAKCDGPSALPLDQLEDFLSDLIRYDALTKQLTS